MKQLIILLLLAPLAAPAEELGRLFYTPQQRQQLDYQNVHSAAPSQGAQGGVIVVKGVVQKQGGNRTIWLNDTPQLAGRGNDADPASVPIKLPGQSQTIRAKVGQRVLVEPPPTAEDD